MGIFGRSQNIIKTAEYLHKASPVFVHLLMIVGVAVYTLFGAVVMRNLESKVAEETRTVEKRTSRSIFEKGIKTNLTVKQHSLRHSRSYFYKNETGFNFTELINSQTINEKSRRDLANIMRSRQCVIGTLQKFIDFDCSESVMHSQILKLLDSCYHVTVDNQKEFENIEFLHSLDELKITNVEKKEYIKPWSFSDSVLFAFTVITTIGYGNVAPKTFNGRLFCIFYGLIGIPFTLLAIADLGKFISEVIDSWENTCKKFYKKLKKRYDKAFKKDGLKQSFSNGSVNQNIQTPNGISKNVDEEFKPLTKDKSSIFDVTTIEANDNILEDTRTGEYIEADLERGPEIPTESPKKSTGTTSEEEMEQSQALSLLIFFVMYTFVGAALLSAYEPDMTFFKAIYFNFVSLSSIGLGDIYPKSETYMAFTIVYIAIGLALTTIAIEIAADYLKKLHYFGRKIENVGNVAIWFGGKKLTMKQLVRNLGDQFNLPIHTVKNLDLDTFVDNAIKVEEGQLETLRPPPIEPEDLMIESNVTFADDEKEEWIPQPTPPKTPTPTPKTPTPPPKEPTPTPPKTPTPPPKTPTPPPKEPTPPPKTPTPPRTPTPPPKEPTPPSSPQPKTLTAAELAAQKRRAYSEEAWRRYQEYQKQWKKFRQTQRNAPANPKHAKTPGDEHEESEQRSGTTSPALTDTTSRPSSSMDNQTSVTPSNSNISASSHFSRIRTSVTPEPFGDNQNGIRSRTASVSSSRKSPISSKSPQPSHDVTKVIDEEKTAAKPEKIDIDTIEEPKTNIVKQRRRLFE